MNSNNSLVKARRLLIEIAAIVVIYVVGGVLSAEHNLISFLWLLVGCIGLFLYYSIRSRNLLDLRAILLASITGGVACCQLRLSEIQVVWETETWVCHTLALCCFCVGFAIAERKSTQKLETRISQLWNKHAAKKIKFGFCPKKVYYATIFLAVMPIVLFCIQVAIKGFIPIFVKRFFRFFEHFFYFFQLFFARLFFFVFRKKKVAFFRFFSCSTQPCPIRFIFYTALQARPLRSLYTSVLNLFPFHTSFAPPSRKKFFCYSTRNKQATRH